MTDSDKPQYTVIIEALAATFRVEPTKALLLGYWLGTEDLGLGDVKHAATTAMRRSRFMPTVAELRELAGEMLPAHRAVLAWQATKDAMRPAGIYNSVDFDDKVINATIRNLGGWEAFSIREEEEGDKWLRKDFERVYQSLLVSGVGAEAAAPLLGIHARTNGFLGFHKQIPEPLLITTGLPRLAQQRRRIEKTTDDQKLLAGIGGGSR